MTGNLSWLVVVSNIYYILPSYVLLSSFGPEFAWESVDFIFLGLVSSIWHSCSQTSIGWCPYPYSTLLDLDMLLAYLSVTNVVSPFVGSVNPHMRILYRTLMYIASFFVAMLSNETSSIFLIGSASFLTLSVCIYRMMPSRISSTRIIAIFVLGVAAILCYVYDSTYEKNSIEFQSLHSLWHALSAMSAAILLSLLPFVRTHSKPLSSTSDRSLYTRIRVYP